MFPFHFSVPIKWENAGERAAIRRSFEGNADALHAGLWRALVDTPSIINAQEVAAGYIRRIGGFFCVRKKRLFNSE